MKRIAALLLVLALLLPCLGMADTLWYCPKCGRPNNDNFCPTDGTARPATGASNATALTYSNYAYEPALLNQKMATRTGPGTLYDEPGTFLSAGTQVLALSRAYDDRNGIWWIQVEFTSGGARMRAYTGAKRFSNLNLSALPQDLLMGACTLLRSTAAYYGPGPAYSLMKNSVPAGTSAQIYGLEFGGDDDYLLVEFYDAFQGCSRRAWVPLGSVSSCTFY